MTLLSVFGGGLASWNIGYMILAAATAVVAILLAWQDGLQCLARLPWTARLGLIGIAVVPLLQIIPLPPALWHALPGAALRRDTLMLVGMDGTWQPLSLEPGSTALVAILAIGFVALTSAFLRLDDQQFRRILLLASVIVAVNIAIGLLQVVSNGQPRFHALGLTSTLLGFFANKNHMAIVLACSILIFGLVVARDMFGRSHVRGVVIGYIVLAMVCLVTTNSRAGLVFGAIACLVVLADLGRGIAKRWWILTAALFLLLVVAVLSSEAFHVVSSRVGETDSDLRWKFSVWSWPLAQQFWLSGSGLGSFTTVYATREHVAWLMPIYVNAVHDDYLQLVIEAGVPGLIVLALLAAAVVGGVLAWRRLPRRDVQWREGLLGLTMIALFALHSSVDYPLRRPAAWVFLALAFAALFRIRRATRGAAGAQADPA